MIAKFLRIMDRKIYFFYFYYLYYSSRLAIDYTNLRQRRSILATFFTLAFDFDFNYLDDYFMMIRDLINNKCPYHPPGSGYLSAPFVALFGVIDNFKSYTFQAFFPDRFISYYGFCCNAFYTLLGFHFLSKLMDYKKLYKYKNLYYC